MSIGNKYAYQARYFRPTQPKKKPVPVSVRMTNSTAEVVLRERKVEIKDLESRVSFLQNQLKTLNVENKTLRDVINRQEKDLRKNRDGVTDIPSLLRSHKDEIKSFESNAASLRRELRDTQKELKCKCDAILRKDQQIEKLGATSKRHEKHLQEVTAENKELKLEKKKLEEECKKLSIGNEEFKSKNERLQKKVQQMTTKILNLEESLGSSDHHKLQLKEDLLKLQKNYDELLQNLSTTKSQMLVSTIATQTENLNLQSSLPKKSNFMCQIDGDKITESNINEFDLVENTNILADTVSREKNIHPNSSEIPKNNQTFELSLSESRFHKSSLLKPIKPKSIHVKTQNDKSDISPVDSNCDAKPYFAFNSPYLPSNIFPARCSPKNFGNLNNLYYNAS